MKSSAGTALGALTLAALAVSLTACSGTPATHTPSPAAVSPSASLNPTPPPDPSPSSTSPQVGRIGTAQAVTLPGGVAVSIPKIAVHSVPKSVGTGPGVDRSGDHEAVLTIVVRNGSAKPIDTTLLAVDMTASGEQASGMDYSEIPTNNISDTILPGKTATGTYGFVIRQSDIGNLQAEVWAGQTEPHAIFTDSDGTT